LRILLFAHAQVARCLLRRRVTCRGSGALLEIGQDGRFALRGFRRSPAFVATVVLTIAPGLGLYTCVFTMFDAYVLRPLAIWAPVTLLSRLEGSEDLFGAKQPQVLRAVLRLKPGVDARQARAALATWAANATASLADTLRWTHVDLVSVASALPLTDETIEVF